MRERTRCFLKNFLRGIGAFIVKELSDTVYYTSIFNVKHIWRASLVFSLIYCTSLTSPVSPTIVFCLSPSCLTRSVRQRTPSPNISCGWADVQWHHVEKCFHPNIVTKKQNVQMLWDYYSLLTGAEVYLPCVFCFSEAKLNTSETFVCPARDEMN